MTPELHPPTATDETDGNGCSRRLGWNSHQRGVMWWTNPMGVWARRPRATHSGHSSAQLCASHLGIHFPSDITHQIDRPTLPLDSHLLMLSHFSHPCLTLRVYVGRLRQQTSSHDPAQSNITFLLTRTPLSTSFLSHYSSWIPTNHHVSSIHHQH